MIWGQTETLGTILYVPVSKFVPDNTREVWPWGLRAGMALLCVVLGAGFMQGPYAALSLGLSFWMSGAALPCFPVLGQELSAQGTPETSLA